MRLVLLLACIAEASPAVTPPPAETQRPSGNERPVRRTTFDRGVPAIPVRLVEQVSELTVQSRGGLTLRDAAGAVITKLAPGARVRVARKRGESATVLARLVLGEVRLRERHELEGLTRELAEQGIPFTTQVLGDVVGISGHVLDNRIFAVIFDEPPRPKAEAMQRQAELLATKGYRTTLLEDTTVPSTIELAVFDADGRLLAEGPGPLKATPDTEVPLEYALGGPPKRYRGNFILAADQFGTIALVNEVSLEDLMRGLVPAEIFPKAPAEALRAQAVTARGEVLAKIGRRHRADPYFICAEQHCAVYRGVAAETPTTDAAVLATRGEVLLDAEGYLVDSVFSAVCGGHTENNEAVWGTPKDPSLRGRPDVLPGKKLTATPQNLEGFLAERSAFACGNGAFATAHRFRWTKRITRDEATAFLRHLHVGEVMSLVPTERGVSGRLIALQVSGTEAAATIRGELNIRRAFGNLNSAMFTIRPERGTDGRVEAWTFDGGGWGHGVGLCQLGAVGRAEAGQRYRDILSHYFGGARVVRIY